MLQLQFATSPVSESFTDGLNLSWRVLSGWSNGFFKMLPNMIVGALVLAVFVFVALIARYIVFNAFSKRGKDDLAAMMAGLALWVILAFGTLISLTVVLPSLSPGNLLASLGVGTIAIGFAFKDILQNWLAGVLILLRQPFRRGDQIRVNDKEGTIQHITSRAVYIKTYDNIRIIIPNSEVYSNPITVNTAYEMRRVTLDITVGYDYEFRRIAQIIMAEIKSIDDVLAEPAPQILAWDLGATSLGIKIRWWIEPQRSQEIASRARVVQAIKEAFEANDIDPTDPQLIYYHEVPSPAEEEQSGADQQKEGTGKLRSIVRAPPQPDFEGDPNDPENDRPQDEEVAVDR